MLSIPQNMQNEAKNIIKNVFLENCRNLFLETIDNLFYSFSPSKYIEFNLNLISKINAML